MGEKINKRNAQLGLLKHYRDAHDISIAVLEPKFIIMGAWDREQARDFIWWFLRTQLNILKPKTPKNNKCQQQFIRSLEWTIFLSANKPH